MMKQKLVFLTGGMSVEIDHSALKPAAIMVYVVAVIAFVSVIALGLGFLTRLGWDAAGSFLS